MEKQYIRKEATEPPPLPFLHSSAALKGSREGATEYVYDVDEFRDVEHLEAYVNHWGEDFDYHNTLMPAVISRRQHLYLKNGKKLLASVLLADTELGEYCRDWAAGNPSHADPVIHSYCLRGGGEECDCILRDANAYYWHMSHARGMETVQPHQWYNPCRDADNYMTTWRTRTQAAKAGKIPTKVEKAVSKAANELANASADPEQTKKDLETLSAAPLKWHPLSNWKRRHIVHHIKQHPFTPATTRYSSPKQGMSDYSDSEYSESFDKPSYGHNPRYDHAGKDPTTGMAIIFVIVIILLVLGAIWLFRSAGGTTESACANGKCARPTAVPVAAVPQRDTIYNV